MRRVRVLVSGRVQGVWFRESCRREAEAAGLTGWVQNRADGRVEAAFQGSPDGVGRLIEWCRRGPPHALVTGIEVQEETPVEGETAFRVR